MGESSDAAHGLRALYDAHASSIYAFSLRATGDRQVAEEIVQDTFVRAWQAIDRFDPHKGEARTWLHAIARNLIADHYRRQGARPSTPVPNEEFGQAAPSDIDRVMELWQIEEALDRISRPHRDAIVEVYLRGASVPEAAERLGVPPGTVKSRVYYGLRALRLALEELGAVR